MTIPGYQPMGLATFVLLAKSHPDIRGDVFVRGRALANKYRCREWRSSHPSAKGAAVAYIDSHKAIVLTTQGRLRYLSSIPWGR